MSIQVNDRPFFLVNANVSSIPVRCCRPVAAGSLPHRVRFSIAPGIWRRSAAADSHVVGQVGQYYLNPHLASAVQTAFHLARSLSSG